MDKAAKILIFGAGKIGRSFVGQLFSRAGYEVLFIEKDARLVDLLNEQGGYAIHVRESRHPEREETIRVEGIRALHTRLEKEVIREIETADIMATAVGQAGLRSLQGLLATGLYARYLKHPGRPVDLILAENQRDAADAFRQGLLDHAPELPVEEYVGLVETSIGKMVPVMTRDQLQSDPLAIYAEAYNTLILDADAFRNPIPEVEGLQPEKNMKAWVERKLFIHNLGHAALAYQAHHMRPDLVYTWEALDIPSLNRKVRDTMFQSASILRRRWPEAFDYKSLADHITDLLERFANKALGDTIFRVGSDLPRKLGPEDRLLAPALAGLGLSAQIDLILEAWLKGCQFAAKDENGQRLPEDLAFTARYGTDYRKILGEHCHLDPVSLKYIDQIIEPIIPLI